MIYTSGMKKVAIVFFTDLNFAELRNVLSFVEDTCGQIARSTTLFGCNQQ
jgi:hypothetical protein